MLSTRLMAGEARIDKRSDRKPPFTIRVSLLGEHDQSTAPGLERQLEDQLDLCDRLVVDLGGVAFMDSSVARCLRRVALLARARGVVFEVAPPEGLVAGRLLELLGLMGYFGLSAHSAPSRADASS